MFLVDLHKFSLKIRSNHFIKIRATIFNHKKLLVKMFNSKTLNHFKILAFNISDSTNKLKIKKIYSLAKVHPNCYSMPKQANLDK